MDFTLKFYGNKVCNFHDARRLLNKSQGRKIYGAVALINSKFSEKKEKRIDSSSRSDSQ